MIEIIKAPPFATVQDRGWRIGRAIGLPRSGAMDRRGLERANAHAGNPPGAAALEWALGSGTLRFDARAIVAVSGWGVVHLDGEATPAARGEHRLTVPAGRTVTLLPDPRWRFLYVAIRGGIDVPEVMGSRSTYLPGGFGGYQGRRLRSGDRLPIGGEPASRPSSAASTQPLELPGGEVTLAVTPGPQWDRFDDAARSTFFTEQYRVSTASDRMGYRLTGTPIAPIGPADLPSEAACPGAVQIPDAGTPIVLMPDGPTVGGYPKLVVVREADLGRLAQSMPGATVRFRLDA